MTPSCRFASVRMGRLVAASAGILFLVSLSVADSAKDTTSQQDKQKQVQADTERTVRRMNTMIRLLTYNQLDKESESKVLDEVAQTLAGLSREQMTDILARLEVASRARDETKSQKELETAYVRHREVITILKSMLAKYDAIKNLDQAGERLENAAKEQLEIHLKTSQAVQERKNTVEQLFTTPKAKAEAAAKIRNQADDQKDLRQDVANLLKQVQELRDALPADQKERLAKMEAALQAKAVLNEMAKAAELLESRKESADKANEALDLQRKAAADLQELARELRGPKDRLQALR